MNIHMITSPMDPMVLWVPRKVPGKGFSVLLVLHKVQTHKINTKPEIKISPIKKMLDDQQKKPLPCPPFFAIMPWVWPPFPRLNSLGFALRRMRMVFQVTFKHILPNGGV